MVRIKFHPLYPLASSITHDLFRQEANSVSSLYVLMSNNGRDVTRASHTSRLYPGLYAVIKTMWKMQIQLLCACVLYSMGSRGLKQWVWRHKSHMGEMRDSDWSRPKILRSDWLLLIGAIMTTTGPDQDWQGSRSRSKPRDPFNQNVWKFRSKTQWIGSVQPKKFRKNGSTFLHGPLFKVDWNFVWMDRAQGLCNASGLTFAWLILGDPGAASWDDKMFVVKAYLKIEAGG